MSWWIDFLSSKRRNLIERKGRSDMKEIYSGVWQAGWGEPESQTPVRWRRRPVAEKALKDMPLGDLPILLRDGISARSTTRGFQISIEIGAGEQFYGLGLQLLSFNQRGKKKTLRVNSDPVVDLGDSHAPVPFFVSTEGYGVLVDTARYATFYMGSAVPVGEVSSTQDSNKIKLSTEELYRSENLQRRSQILIEIPGAKGADIYLFAGPTLLEAVQRYNLFSGGGCLPPRWGLGVWYRCRGDFDQSQVLTLAEEFRESKIPCDVIGLEPNWQSHVYACSYVWSDKFPDPSGMIGSLKQMNYQINLWEHIFVDSSSPIYKSLLPYSGNYKVFNGIVPDLTIPEARKIFTDHHISTHVALGISSYKLDECDNSDFQASPWSFPELSEFPSGLDGEQMHSLLGINYADTIESIFRKRNQRTYGTARNIHALAANFPFVLCSDLYRHQDFIHGLVNGGFSGLLWTPEVRDAESEEDLIRRLQTVVLSPMALVNGWYIKNPPWKQWRKDENNRDEFLPDWKRLEGICRKILNLRMQLIPYLYSAFAKYAQTGLPPFRALVLDYPKDQNTWTLDNQYMMGDRIMVAPVIAGESKRKIYFPEGAWRDFWTNERIAGLQSLELEVPLDKIPIYVKDDSLLPLSGPALHVNDPAAVELTIRVYGNGSREFTLYEDDGASFDFEKKLWSEHRLFWNTDSKKGGEEFHGLKSSMPYHILRWEPYE
jgi:alpha-D-xyloside xylohydrolase